MSKHMITPQPAVFQSSLRGKVRLFSWLIIGALLMLPTAVLLMFLINVDDTVICEGTVIPKDTFELVAPTGGAVREIFCRSGNQVKKGDLLVQLDDTDYQNEKKRVEAAIRILKSELLVKEHDLKLQLDATEYIQNASKVEAAIKSLEKAYQVKKNELEVLKLEPLPETYRHAAARLEAAEKAYEAAKTSLDNFKKVMTPREIESYERSERDAKLELAIRRENNRVVTSGYAENVIRKAENELQVIESQIAEKKVELNILKQRIADRSDAGKANPESLSFKIAEKARSEISVIRSQIAEKEVELGVLNKKIEDCKIRAVEDGIILSLPCKDSRYVDLGKPAVIMGSLELSVRADVDTRFIRKVRFDQKAEISSDVFSRLQYGDFSASVVKIGTVPLEGTTLYPVYLALETEECDIKVGSKAEVTIITGTQPAIYAFMNITKDDEDALRLRERRRRGN